MLIFVEGLVTCPDDRIQKRYTGIIPEEFTKTLTLKNYSHNTIRTYKAMLAGFLNFIPERIPRISQRRRSGNTYYF
ncbi:MAG TPA: hypothetical protein PK711_12420 [Bacteroidales bacterium]|nr:hypothetical protein [Bacteroidales bacterium]